MTENNGAGFTKWGVLVTLLLLLPTFYLFPGPQTASAQSGETLQVTFLDVGQGDSSLVSTGGGFDILIDGGPSAAGSTLLAYLNDQGITDLEVIVISHQHADHIGGLIDVFQSSIHVETVLYNGNSCTTVTCQNLWAAVDARGITPTTVEAGDVFQWDTISTAVLNPQPSPTGDENEDSVVMDLSFFDQNILYTGDIGFSTETVLINQGLLDPADVLKVAHHGSAYSTSTAFLDIVNPRDAVISVGDNSYGHPSPETITRLDDSGAGVHRTDLDGNVTFSFSEPVLEPTASTIYLPVVFQSSGSSPQPPLDPMPGDNEQCAAYGDAQICASVSDASPPQYADLTVYGRLLLDGVPQSDMAMHTVWHYKSTSPTCDTGITNTNGIAECTRPIGRATIGYEVYINVEIEGYGVTTSFTPAD